MVPEIASTENYLQNYDLLAIDWSKMTGNHPVKSS